MEAIEILNLCLWIRMCALIISAMWALPADNVSCLGTFRGGLCLSPLNLPSIRVMPRYDYDSIKCQEFASCTNSILLPRPPSSPSSTTYQTTATDRRSVVCSLFCLSFFPDSASQFISRHFYSFKLYQPSAALSSVNIFSGVFVRTLAARSQQCLLLIL